LQNVHSRKIETQPIMSFEKILYKYEEPHGIGDVYFIWQKALLATTGTDGSVALYNRQGQLVQRIILSG